MMAARKSTWQLQTAKARFSELFQLARSQGPQWFSRRGKESDVILPAEEFEAPHAGAAQGRAQPGAVLSRNPLFARARLRLERTADYGSRSKL